MTNWESNVKAEICTLGFIHQNSRTDDDDDTEQNTNTNRTFQHDEHPPEQDRRHTVPRFSHGRVPPPAGIPRARPSLATTMYSLFEFLPCCGSWNNIDCGEMVDKAQSKCKLCEQQIAEQIARCIERPRGQERAPICMSLCKFHTCHIGQGLLETRDVITIDNVLRQSIININ